MGREVFMISGRNAGVSPFNKKTIQCPYCKKMTKMNLKNGDNVDWRDDRLFDKGKYLGYEYTVCCDHCKEPIEVWTLYKWSHFEIAKYT